MHPETMVLMTNKHPDGLSEAEGIIGDEGTSELVHPDSLSCLQTMVWKVIGVQCPQCLQCHTSWTAQMDPDNLDEVGGTGKKCT